MSLILIILLQTIKNNKWFRTEDIISVKYYLHSIVRFRPIRAGLLHNDLLRSSSNVGLIPYYLERDRGLIHIIDLRQFETTHDKYTKSTGFFTNWTIPNNYIFAVVLQLCLNDRFYFCQRFLGVFGACPPQNILIFIEFLYPICKKSEFLKINPVYSIFLFTIRIKLVINNFCMPANLIFINFHTALPNIFKFYKKLLLYFIFLIFLYFPEILY